MASTTPTRPPMVEDSRSKLIRRSLYALLVLIGVGLMTAVALRNDGSTTDLAITSTEGLERLIPARGDEVPRQNDVGADLESGYRGRLVINDIEIPDRYLRRGPDNALNEVITRPGTEGPNGEDPVLPSLLADTNCAIITLWPVDRPEAEKSIRWCFQAT